MTKTLVQPENLTNLLRSDASVSFASETGRIRGTVCDNTVEPLRILEVYRGVEQVTDINVEHLVGMIKSSLMNQFALAASRWQGIPDT